MEIRPAQLTDAPALVVLSRETFTETFGAGYPPQDLAAFLETAYTVADYSQQINDPSSGVWVLADGDDLCGYVTAGRCKLPSQLARPEDGEIKRLYLLQKYQRCGWGTKLFETALNWLIDTNHPVLWLGVWSENFDAQKLYQRYGFDYADEYQFQVGESRDREFIYRRIVA